PARAPDLRLRWQSELTELRAEPLAKSLAIRTLGLTVRTLDRLHAEVLRDLHERGAELLSHRVLHCKLLRKLHQYRNDVLGLLLAMQTGMARERSLRERREWRLPLLLAGDALPEVMAELAELRVGAKAGLPLRPVDAQREPELRQQTLWRKLRDVGQHWN